MNVPGTGTSFYRLESVGTNGERVICEPASVRIENTVNPEPVGRYLALRRIKFSHSRMPVTGAPKGVFIISNTLINRSSTALKDLFFWVIVLSGGNVVLNADGGPGGSGATVSVPPSALGKDGVLTPGECFNVDFRIGLTKLRPFFFWVGAYGVPQARAKDSLGGLDDGFQFEIRAEDLEMAEEPLAPELPPEESPYQPANRIYLPWLIGR